MRDQLIWGIGFLLFLNALFQGGEGEILQYLSPLLTLVLLFLLLFSMMKGKEGFSFLKSPLHLPLLFFSLSLLLSTLFSQSRGNSLLGLSLQLSYLTACFLGTQILPSKGNAERTGILLILISILEAFYALGQRFFLGSERVTGTFRYASFFIDPLLIGTSFILGFLLFDPLKNWKRVLLLSLLPFSLLALFFSGTRAVLPTLLSILLFLGFMKGRRMTTLFLLASLLLLLMVSLFPNPLRDRLHQEKDLYSFQRVRIWQTSFQVFLDHPLFGVGLKNFEFVSPPYNFPVEGAVGRYARKVEIPHNQYLDTACHSGLLGILAFLLLLSIGMKAGFQSFHRGGVYAGSLAGFLSLLVHFLFDNPLYLPLNGFTFYLLIGLLGGSTSPAPPWFRGKEESPSSEGKDETQSQPLVSRRRLGVFLLILFLALAWVLVKPLAAALFYEKGLREAKGKFYSEAIRSCHRSSTLLPSEALYHDALATLYWKVFEEEGNPLHFLWAYMEHQSAVDAHPIHPFYRENFANHLYSHREEAGRLGIKVDEEILRLIRSAISLDPYNPFYRRKLAILYAELGEKEKAIEILKEILTIEPHFLIARYQLILLLKEIGKEEDAQRHYQTLLTHLEEDLPSRVQSPYEEDLVLFDRNLLKNLTFP